jgi:hypothetical protein
MAFDDNTFTTTLTTAVTDSFTSEEDNSVNVDATATGSFNEDNSVHDSGNAVVDVNDSFKNDSDNVEWDIDDSGNTGSYNDTWSFTDASETDNSVNAGVRSYNTGIDGLAGGAAAGGAGDVMINNQNTIVDQSLNGNVAADGPVFQGVGGSSIVASGDDSWAAGGDITSTIKVDESTNISADGDVLIDSEKTVDWDINSGNTETHTFTYTDESTNVEIDDSFNPSEYTTTITDSFTDDSLVFDYDDVDVTVDAVVGSTVTDIGDIDVAF